MQKITIANSVNFNDYPQTSQHRSENYPFFPQNKNITHRCNTRHQKPYYTANYVPSDDEEYYNQSFYQNQRPRSYNIDQPDTFEPYTREE